ncbi:aminotransferase class I/II-fold pyridoxal phosphate-dependent enzyme [Roseibium salinum]|nr:aminotransferase class I/II-fold pyridoxal phosphate-dependent enzyme [Roseibium salinum]
MLFGDLPHDGAPRHSGGGQGAGRRFFSNIVVLNSLSKRSNLAGLRCGFAAGDPEFLRKWARFRGLAAPQVPLPAQAVAVRAYQDEAHVIENRRLYNEKFEVAERYLRPILGPVTPEAGFFPVAGRRQMGRQRLRDEKVVARQRGQGFCRAAIWHPIRRTAAIPVATTFASVWSHR